MGADCYCDTDVEGDTSLGGSHVKESMLAEARELCYL